MSEPESTPEQDLASLANATCALLKVKIEEATQEIANLEHALAKAQCRRGALIQSINAMRTMKKNLRGES